MATYYELKYNPATGKIENVPVQAAPTPAPAPVAKAPAPYTGPAPVATSLLAPQQSGTVTSKITQQPTMVQQIPQATVTPKITPQQTTTVQQITPKAPAPYTGPAPVSTTSQMITAGAGMSSMPQPIVTTTAPSTNPAIIQGMQNAQAPEPIPAVTTPTATILPPPPASNLTSGVGAAQPAATAATTQSLLSQPLKPAVTQSSIGTLPPLTSGVRTPESFAQSEAMQSDPTTPKTIKIPNEGPDLVNTPQTIDNLTSLLGSTTTTTQQQSPILPPPEYTGISETELNAWGQDLLSKGETEIEKAYQDSYSRMRDVLGAQGMYGSSIMADVAADLASKKAAALQQNIADVQSKVMAAKQADAASRNQFMTDIYKEQGLGARQLTGQEWSTSERLGEQSYKTGERLGAQSFTVYQDRYKADIDAMKDARLQGYTLEQISADYAGKAGISQSEHINRMGELAQAYGFDIGKLDKQQENTLAAMAADAGYTQTLEGIKSAVAKDLLVMGKTGDYIIQDAAQAAKTADLQRQLDAEAANLATGKTADYILQAQKGDIDSGLLKEQFGYDTSKMSEAQKNALSTMIADYYGKYYLQDAALKTTPQSQIDAQNFSATENQLNRENAIRTVPLAEPLSDKVKIEEVRGANAINLANVTGGINKDLQADSQAFTAGQNTAQQGYVIPAGGSVTVPDWNALWTNTIEPGLTEEERKAGYWTPDKAELWFNNFGQAEGATVPMKTQQTYEQQYVPGTEQEMANILIAQKEKETGKALDAAEKQQIWDTVKELGSKSIGALKNIIPGSGSLLAAPFSDSRLKKDVVTIDKALDKVKRLRGVRFNWIDQSDGIDPEIGVIAQEIEQVLPEVIAKPDKGFKQVKYGNIVAVLIEAIKELSDKIESMEAKNVNEK